jgi:hypothetical protein
LKDTLSSLPDSLVSMTTRFRHFKLRFWGEGTGADTIG